MESTYTEFLNIYVIFICLSCRDPSLNNGSILPKDRPLEMQARSLCFHFSHYLENKTCMFNLSNMYHTVQTVTAASSVGVPWSTDDDVSWAAADVLPR